MHYLRKDPEQMTGEELSRALLQEQKEFIANYPSWRDAPQEIVAQLRYFFDQETALIQQMDSFGEIDRAHHLLLADWLEIPEHQRAWLVLGKNGH
jgi:hypothetical protein